MARRQAVDREGRRVYLEPALGSRRTEIARQSAERMVRQPRAGLDQWRIRNDLLFEAAAARVSYAARLGVFTGLPLPRDAAPNAATSNRHGTVQIRRIQAERTH